jgi:geranylgeranyl diphosphate synthase type II
MQAYQDYKTQFERYLEQHYKVTAPTSLYEPAHYILNIGGKRFRPVTVLLIADLIGEINPAVLEAAMGIEVFHNFTLVHDDIMDQADLRRGQATVHKKYNLDTGILSGDVMLIQATQFLLRAEHLASANGLTDQFVNVAREICEGQQLDMDFEERTDVSRTEYLEMIRKKTAVLLGYSMFTGAYLGGAQLQEAKAISVFGEQSGLAFQIWDDYLDVFGDQKVGKKQAGDIYNKKETLLIIELKNQLSGAEAELFHRLWKGNISDKSCNQIIDLMQKAEIPQIIRKQVDVLMEEAIQELQQKVSKKEWTKPISDFALQFINRSH